MRQSRRLRFRWRSMTASKGLMVLHLCLASTDEPQKQKKKILFDVHLLLLLPIIDTDPVSMISRESTRSWWILLNRWCRKIGIGGGICVWLGWGDKQPTASCLLFEKCAANWISHYIYIHTTAGGVVPNHPWHIPTPFISQTESNWESWSSSFFPFVPSIEW
jgi:hypothetical protein